MRFPVRATFALTLVLAAAWTSVFAQERTGVVSGHVLNSRGNEPLALVQVTLTDTAFSAVTDEQGAFRFEGLSAGTYELQTTLVGFSRIRQPFTLAAGEAKAFDVVMTLSTITLTDSTSVTAGVFDAIGGTSGGFTVGTEETRNLASVLADDPLRAVQRLPGVTANDDFSSEFAVRGAPFDRVGLYLDGVLLHSPLHTTDGQAANGSLAAFSGELIDDMTLYQGVWPVRYSDRTAGILAVETRPGTREAFRAQVSASASNGGLLAEGPLGHLKRGSWVVAVRKSYLQYLLNRIDFGDEPPLAFAFADAQGRLDFDLSSQYTFTVTVLDGSSSVDRTRFQKSLGPNTVMTSGFRTSLVNAGLRYTSPHLLLMHRVAWSGERGHVANRDALPLSRQHFGSLTARTDATVISGTRRSIDVGGLIQREQSDGLSTQLVYAPELLTSRDQYDGAAVQAGAYGQASLDFGRIDVAFGARVDGHSIVRRAVASPYASLAFRPLPATKVQVSCGSYGQFPQLSQIRSVFAQGALVPERAAGCEASIEQRLDERTRVRAEFYDREDRHLLARPGLDPRVDSQGAVVLATPAAALLNAQSGSSRGVQLFLQRRSANGFTGWASYSYGRAVTTDETLGLSYPSDYDQRHTVNVYASRRVHSTINLSAHLTYGTGNPLPGFYALRNGDYAIGQARNALRATAYQRTDVRMNKAQTGRWFEATWYLELVNITNHANRDFDSAGPYDPVSRRAQPAFYSMFPILPSAGVVITFGGGTTRKPV